MTFKEKINVWFHKDECLRVIIFDEKKRATSRIVRVKKEDIKIELGEVSYIIDVELVYYLEGLPTLTYHITNPNPINPVKSKSDDFESKKMNKMFKTKIVGDMIDSAEDDGFTLKNLIIIGMIITIVVLGIGLYLLYKETQALQTSIDEYNDVIALIKDYLLQNGGR